MSSERSVKDLSGLYKKALERAMGIEPTSEAWEASILPLYDARSTDRFYPENKFWYRALMLAYTEAIECLRPFRFPQS